MDSFISSSIIYPAYSKFNCLQGVVYITFKLDHQGRIYSSKVEKGMGLDLDDEALRVVRLSSGKWVVPPSFDTTQSITLPINFTLKEYNCELKDKEALERAVAAYKAREDLVMAVTNFYRKKYAGETNAQEEQKIIEIKEQLGLDENYIDRLIREGKQKLKQADEESACENFQFVRNLGSDKADKLIKSYCH